MHKNFMAMPLAWFILFCINLTGGSQKFADRIAIDLCKFIWRCGRSEYKDLEGTQKKDCGTVIDESAIKTLNWRKNEKGKDTTLLWRYLGSFFLIDIDIKSSMSSKNRDKKGSMPSGWQISLECWSNICILISFCPYTHRLSLGILDCSVKGYLRPLKGRKGRRKAVKNGRGGGPKRDKKRSVSDLGKRNILWIIYEMPTNKNNMPEHKEFYDGLYRLVDKILEKSLTKGPDKKSERIVHLLDRIAMGHDHTDAAEDEPTPTTGN